MRICRAVDCAMYACSLKSVGCCLSSFLAATYHPCTVKYAYSADCDKCAAWYVSASAVYIPLPMGVMQVKRICIKGTYMAVPCINAKIAGVHIADALPNLMNFMNNITKVRSHTDSFFHWKLVSESISAKLFV